MIGAERSGRARVGREADKMSPGARAEPLKKVPERKENPLGRGIEVFALLAVGVGG